MAAEQDNIRVLPPSPIDEQRPLLGDNDQQADHGTIDRDVAGQEEEGDGEVPDEPTTAKITIIMWSMWVGSFWAAMGGFHASRSEIINGVLMNVHRLDHRCHSRLSHQSKLPFFNFALMDRNRVLDRKCSLPAAVWKTVGYLW